VKANLVQRSLRVTLPAHFAQALGWHPRDYLVVELDTARQALVVSAWQGQASAVAIAEQP
jgi:antitoxin component of MazEF toxin-antitoxin module